MSTASAEDSAAKLHDWRAEEARAFHSARASKAESSASEELWATWQVPPAEEPLSIGERRRRIAVRGEAFLLEWEEDVVHLVHPRWSLVGTGDTLFDAEKDLAREARDVAEALKDAPPQALNDDARALRDFALQFLGLRTG